MRRHAFTLLICAMFAASGLFLRASFAAPTDAAPPALVQKDAGAGLLGTSPSITDPETDPGGFARDVYDAYQSRNYRALFAGVGMVVVYVLRRFSKTLQSDRAGAATALGVGVVGAFVATMAADVPLHWGLLVDGLMMGVQTAGGWVVIKRLVAPKDLAEGTA
jgi:hypothetical protein